MRLWTALLSDWAWNPCQKDEATRLPEFDKGRSTYLGHFKKEESLANGSPTVRRTGLGGQGLHFCCLGTVDMGFTSYTY